MWVWCLVREAHLEKEMANHSSILTWKTPGTEEPGRLESQRVGQNWKGKGEKERYIHLNAEFQRIARRETKAFLSDQCKNQEKNRMENIRDLFKKIRETKGAFHAKIRTIKDRNSMDLTEAEEMARIHRTIQKRSSWPRNHDGVIIHLEPGPGMWSQVGLRKH